MIVSIKRARTVFVAALACYLLWVGALVALAVVSGARPGDRRARIAPEPVAVPVAP
jgi:hypothetical protein